MKTEIKIAGRIKGLLCLMLSMTMIFGMTLGVHAADAQEYYLSYSNGELIYNAYGSGGQYIPVPSDTLLNKGEKIFVAETNGQAAIYLNGVEKWRSVQGKETVYTLPDVSDTYSFSQEKKIGETYDTSYLNLYLTYEVPQPTPTHTHTFEWRTIREASASQDGEEAYTCTGCGYVSETRGIPASGFLWDDMTNRIANAKAGETVVIDAGLWYSFPKRVMEDIAARRDITVEINIRYLQKNFKITIPKDTAIDTSCDWYGPEKLTQMFGREEIVK